jgi:hypothetical protein
MQLGLLLVLNLTSENCKQLFIVALLVLYNIWLCRASQKTIVVHKGGQPPGRTSTFTSTTSPKIKLVVLVPIHTTFIPPKKINQFFEFYFNQFLNNH